MAMDKELLKKIPFILGVGLAFITGLLFTILGDLVLKSSSPWLIGGVLLAFGSVACLVLSENFKEKKALFWTLKGIALALALAFIGYMVGFHSAMIVKYAKKAQMLVKNDSVFAVLLVFVCLTAVAQVVDVVFNATLKEKE